MRTGGAFAPWVIPVLLLLIAAVCVLAIALWIHGRMQRRRLEAERQMEEQRQHDARRYHEALLREIESRSILIHDMRRHLVTMQHLSESGHQEELHQYLSDLLSSDGMARSVRVSDCEVLNEILCRYREECMGAQIDFELDVRSGTVDFVDAPDITALFSNLLDNAIAAAKQVPDGVIRLSVRKDESETMITMINSCLPTGGEDAPKDGLHGYGLKSIEKTAKKYHGELLTYLDDSKGMYHTIVTLLEIQEMRS